MNKRAISFVQAMPIQPIARGPRGAHPRALRAAAPKGPTAKKKKN